MARHARRKNDHRPGACGVGRGGLSSLLLMMRAAAAVHTSQMNTLGPATSFATWDSSLPQNEQRSFRPNIASTSFEFEHHTFHAGPHVVRMETKLVAHLQHAGV